MANEISVRVLDEPVYDGSTGAKIEDSKTYQLGATIDGVFVPFLTKQGSYIDHLVKQGKAQQESAPAPETTPAEPEPAAAPPDVPTPEAAAEAETS